MLPGFPHSRPRRLRASETLRDIVRETHLLKSDLISPIFIKSGKNVKAPISSMPDTYHWSVDTLDEEIEKTVSLGIQSVILFGLPEHKGFEEALADKGTTQRAIRKVKAIAPKLHVIADLCVCANTDHGHCGVYENEMVKNDLTLDILCKIAITYAKAGVDMIAPSGMMDGTIQALRTALDAAGYENIGLLGYSVKYASAYYGPFRDAYDSHPKGDRKTYQMDPANSEEALREAELDIKEGADLIMVKPALPYLDIICKVKDKFPVPLVAYNVGGEYAMIKAAAEKGWIDEKKVTLETLISIKRAGADLIITYHAKEVAAWL